ncbi:MAG: transcriptional regulator NrdR [Coriobacteriales bacterium]
MLCPNCGSNESKVIDSRSSKDESSIRRRRECLNCGTRFTTFERCEEEPILVAKRDGHTEPFDPSKLLKSLLTATAKRDIPLGSLQALVEDVENEIRLRYKGPIASSTLGDYVLMKLRDLDKVAYIRFASVYKDFKDVDEFNEELKRLSESATNSESDKGHDNSPEQVRE